MNDELKKNKLAQIVYFLFSLIWVSGTTAEQPVSPIQHSGFSPYAENTAKFKLHSIEAGTHQKPPLVSTLTYLIPVDKTNQGLQQLKASFENSENSVFKFGFRNRLSHQITDLPPEAPQITIIATDRKTGESTQKTASVSTKISYSAKDKTYYYELWLLPRHGESLDLSIPGDWTFAINCTGFDYSPAPDSKALITQLENHHSVNKDSVYFTSTTENGLLDREQGLKHTQNSRPLINPALPGSNHLQRGQPLLSSSGGGFGDDSNDDDEHPPKRPPPMAATKLLFEWYSGGAVLANSGNLDFSTSLEAPVFVFLNVMGWERESS